MSFLLPTVGILASILLSLLIARLALSGLLHSLTRVSAPKERIAAKAPNRA